MSERRQLSERGAARRVGIGILALAAALALAACGDELEGGDEGGEARRSPRPAPAEGEFTISTGPLYIDKGEGGGRWPRRSTLEEFDGGDWGQTSITSRTSTPTNPSSPSCGRISRTASRGAATSSSRPTGWRALRRTSATCRTIDNSAIPNVEKNLPAPAAELAGVRPRTARSRCRGQSGMTGLIVNTDEAPDITSVNDLFDPQYKGKVTVLAELRDTVPLFMKADGIDPERRRRSSGWNTIQKVAGRGRLGAVPRRDRQRLHRRPAAWRQRGGDRMVWRRGPARSSTTRRSSSGSPTRAASCGRTT